MNPADMTAREREIYFQGMKDGAALRGETEKALIGWGTIGKGAEEPDKFTPRCKFSIEALVNDRGEYAAKNGLEIIRELGCIGEKNAAEAADYCAKEAKNEDRTGGQRARMLDVSLALRNWKLYRETLKD